MVIFFYYFVQVCVIIVEDELFLGNWCIKNCLKELGVGVGILIGRGVLQLNIVFGEFLFIF